MRAEKYKILHLEDVLSDAELVARVLKKNNLDFEHKIVDSSAEYENALNSFLPDVILCDHSLPAFNSFEALQIVKKRDLHIPFIVITASMSEEVAMTVVREGADDYILKDRLNRLPFVVINAIDKYRYEKDRKRLIDDAYKNEAAAKSLLQKLSNKLLLATKAAGIGTWEYDLAEQKFIADDILLDIYGIEADEFDRTLETWLTFVDVEDREKVFYEFQQSLMNSHSLDLDFKIVRNDGEVRWIKAIAIVQEDETGKVHRLIGTNQDITASKLADITIRESEEKYRSFFQNSSDGKLITGINGQILSANPAACAMFQRTEAEICALGRTCLVDVSDSKVIQSVKERSITGKTKSEITFFRKDGSSFPGEFTSSVYKNGLGEDMTSVVIRDITERKKTEAALSESEAFSRGVLDSLNSHIAVINQSGTIIRVNRPWRDFAINNGGADNNVFCEGANYFDVLNNRTDQGEEIDHLELNGIKNVLKGQSKEFYLEYPCHSPAEQRWFYMQVRRFESSETLAVIEHFNISERKKAEDQLVLTSDKLKKVLMDLEKIMDSSIDVICSIDLAGKFVSISSAAKSIWGYEPVELIGTAYMDLVFHADKAITKQTAADIVKGNAVTMFENRYVKKDGSIVPIIWSATWDDEAKVMYCIAKDGTEKKRMEKAVDNEQRRLHELFIHAPASVGVLKGREHVFKMANKLFLQLTGRKNIIGKTVREVFPKVESQGLFEILDQVFTTGIPFTTDEKLVQLDKNDDGILADIYLNFLYHPYRNNENVIEGVFFFAVDVTEQVEARKRIEESEKRFRQLIQNLPEAVYTCNLDGKIELYNDAAVRLWGREPVIGQEYWSGAYKTYYINGTPILPEQSAMALTIKSGKGHSEFEKIIEQPTGEKRFARANSIPLFDMNNKLSGAVNMVVDITHLKRVEEKLRTNNERYQIVTKVTNDGIWDWNLKTNKIYWNKRYEIISGYKNVHQQLAIESWFDKIHKDDKDRVRNGVMNTISKAASFWEDEYRYVKANGETANVLDRGYIMYNDQHEPIRFVGAMADITHRKKIETEREILIEHLVKSNNDLKQFSYITSHNFRAPLSNLIGLLSLVDHSTLTEANKEIVKMFETSTQQLNKTINDLIQILIIKNNLDVNLVKNDVNEAIADVCEILAPDIKETGINILKKIMVSEIILNKSYLQSILINLLTNAIKYRSPNRELVIEISTEQLQNGDISMIIKDNGIGIDLKRHGDHVFGLYQRFHSNIEGEGLGLYMVKTQIMALGGKIEVKSEEDKGTAFYITLKSNRNLLKP